MNYIIEKHSNQVVWINSDPEALAGKSAWTNFDSDAHQIVYALHYNPKVGDVFKAEVEAGCAKEFLAKNVYDKKSGVERILQDWEDLILESETEDAPLKNEAGEILPYQVYGQSSGWVVDIDQKKESLLRTANGICESKISSGFFSSALGILHFYGSDRDDQLNLIGAVSLNNSVLYKCLDPKGVKEYRLHTADQIRQALNDGALRKTFLLQKVADLKSCIRTANSLEELSVIDLQSGWD